MRRERLLALESVRNPLLLESAPRKFSFVPRYTYEKHDSFEAETRLPCG
jgi:hypothetical protein